MTFRTKGLIKMLLVGIAAIFVGILIMQHTGSFLKIILIAAGIGSFIDGFYTLVGVRRWCFTDFTKRLAMVKGFESIIIGAGSVVFALFAAETAITVMVYVFAIGLVFSAIVSFQNAAVAKNFDIVDMKSHFIVEGVIQILIALLLFFKPVDTLYKVVQILSIGFVVIGVMMAVISILSMIRGGGKETEAIVEEAEVVDEEKK